MVSYTLVCGWLCLSAVKNNILAHYSHDDLGVGQRPEGGAKMNTYELALVLNGKLEEEAKTEAFEKVKGYIEKFGGNVVNVDDWGKRKLAYEIQKMRDGFYYFITFEATSEVPGEVEKRIRIMESILRFLIVSKVA